jgi:threonine dehydrogenase-like Zn-dependent dehydrogenase
MRAAIFRNGDIVPGELADPVPMAGQVLVKTLACGICGSDLHAAKHAHRMIDVSTRMTGKPRFDLKRDIVFGHEFVCEVIDHGPQTTKAVKSGTRVCSIPVMRIADGITGVGYSNDFPGGYGERMVLTEPFLIPVPNGLSTDHAALTEPLAVGVHAVEMARIKGDEVPLVIGCGPVGLAVIAALKLKKIGPIVAADYSPTRRQLAQKMGADIVVDPARTSAYKTWTEHAALPPDAKPAAPIMGSQTLTKPALVFECVGVPGVLQQIFEGVPRGARIVVVGVCMEPDSTEPMFGISKELNVQYVLGYTAEEFARSLQLIAEGQVDVAPLITGKVGIDGVKGAFAELGNPERHTKILVEPWR